MLLLFLFLTPQLNDVLTFIQQTNTKCYYILGIVPNNENTTVNKTDTIPKEMFYETKKGSNYYSLLLPVITLNSIYELPSQPYLNSNPNPKP